MKIYNEVVIDMNTGTTIYEDSFEYDGPVMRMCGGGGDSGPDYTDQINLLSKQAKDVKAREGGIRDYFEDVKGLTSQTFNNENKSALDSFLSDSYSIGKQDEKAIRTSGFETDSSLTEDIAQTKDSRSDAYENASESRSLSNQKSGIEQSKAYEDQMDQIEDMLYQIKTEKANLLAED